MQKTHAIVVCHFRGLCNPHIYGTPRPTDCHSAPPPSCLPAVDCITPKARITRLQRGPRPRVAVAAESGRGTCVLGKENKNT